jgi:hypothetical protein
MEERRKEEKIIVESMDRKYLLPNELWYIVDIAWVNRWAQFAGGNFFQLITCKLFSGSEVLPGPITNEVLLDPKTKAPKPNLVRGKNYRGIIEPVYKYFQSIYGG